EEVLERELVRDGFGELAFEVDAGPWVVEAAADGVLVRLLVDPGVELTHGAGAERELVVLRRPDEAVVIEVVVGLEVELAAVAIADLLGPAGDGRVAAGDLRPAPRGGGPFAV